MNKNNNFKWEILAKKSLNNGKNNTSKKLIEKILSILLENRGLKTKKEKIGFFEPIHPSELSLKDVGIDQKQLNKALKRIKKALKGNEHIIVYGDYDADGVCATAILWEILYSYTKNVQPYIPDRFEEGYGINPESIKRIKKDDPKVSLIITVDNGIVAHDAVLKAQDLGIEIIITDHHQKEKKPPQAYSVIHTTDISGAGIAWILTREIKGKFKDLTSNDQRKSLGLAAIGTIADQIPLLGPNRSIAKYGLEGLVKTKRPGLLALYDQAGIAKGPKFGYDIGTYAVNYIIAPRINSMGRLEHAVDSLRLLCTKSSSRAKNLAIHLNEVNSQRKEIVDDVILHARESAGKKEWGGAIILAHETYHEGVIGLAASKLVEEYYRPAIVLSKGSKVSKASARSIAGFNIIKMIKEHDHMIVGGGGHPMAAGFSIETKKIKTFIKSFEKASKKLLTEEVLSKKLKVDVELGFNLLSFDLEKRLREFNPTGVGNPRPTFVTKGVYIVNSRTVGRDAKHLKLTLESDGVIMGAIAFGMGDLYLKLMEGKKVDIAYNLEENVWNGKRDLQLKVKDIHLGQ